MATLNILKKIKNEVLSFEKHPCIDLDKEQKIFYLKGLALIANEDGFSTKALKDSGFKNIPNNEIVQIYGSDSSYTGFVPPSDSMWGSIYSSSVYDGEETYKDLTFRLMREI